MIVSEVDLIKPTLEILSKPEFTETGLTISELMPALREIFEPEGHDLEIISTRADDYFSQKVRNLVCHRTLEKLGYAIYVPDGKIGRYVLTESGKELCKRNQLSLPLQ